MDAPRFVWMEAVRLLRAPSPSAASGLRLGTCAKLEAVHIPRGHPETGAQLLPLVREEMHAGVPPSGPSSVTPKPPASSSTTPHQGSPRLHWEERTWSAWTGGSAIPFPSLGYQGTPHAGGG